MLRARREVPRWLCVAFHTSDGSDRSRSRSFSILTSRYEMLCRICTVQIQPKKHVLDHADHTAPTRKHEPHHTDHTDQESICPEKSRSSGTRSYRSSVRGWKVSPKKTKNLRHLRSLEKSNKYRANLMSRTRPNHNSPNSHHSAPKDNDV